ncbi:MAG TPA: DUF302 domain-containing protein [Acidobacteriaceae bacterium]|nr:DUF302 domain-containing protein [Acidobacteriaceae bacterium]
MSTTAGEFSISVRAAGGYRQTLAALREALQRNRLEILSELAVDQELKRRLGVVCERRTVFVVWSPPDAYRAVLGDRDGALLFPCSLCVGEDEASVFVAATNHYGTLGARQAPIGIQALLRDSSRRIRQVLAELAVPEEPLRQPSNVHAGGSSAL